MLTAFRDSVAILVQSMRPLSHKQARQPLSTTPAPGNALKLGDKAVRLDVHEAGAVRQWRSDEHCDPERPDGGRLPKALAFCASSNRLKFTFEPHAYARHEPFYRRQRI